MKKLIKGWLAKGVNISIPTRPKPRQIEHNMREEFERGRVIRTLNRARQIFDSIEVSGWSPEGSEISCIILEISALIRDLEAHKK